MKSAIKTMLAASAVLWAAVAGQGAAADAVTLKLTSGFPESHFLWTQGGKTFIDAVTEATGGKVSFSTFHAGQLGKDQVSLVATGLADMGVIAAPYSPDKLPLTGVVELPGYITGSCDGVKRVWPLMQEGGVLDKAEYEAQGLHVLFVAVPPPYKLMTARQPVTSVASLSGLKIRAVGGAQADTVRAFGGVPVQVQASELYDSLSRGTVDGAIYAFVGMPPYDLGDVVHHSVEGVYAGSLAVLYAIKSDVWKGLPEDTRGVMTESAAKAQQSLCEYQDAEENRIRDDYVTEKELKLARFSDADWEAWRTAIGSVAAGWAKRLDDNGKPGSAILKAFEDAGK